VVLLERRNSLVEQLLASFNVSLNLQQTYIIKGIHKDENEFIM